MTQAIKQCEIRLQQSPIKRLFIKMINEQLVGVSMTEDETTPCSSPDSKITQELEQQLNNYVAQAHNDWSVELYQQGTEFQRRVWHYLQTIPVGETQSYGQIAKALSSSARAVGNACRANPYLLVVPCHRVIAKSGIGGFAGDNDGHAVAIKRWLLEHE